MRKRISAELKSKIALEALKGDKTINEIASLHEVHPNQVGLWKRQFLEGASSIFSKASAQKGKDEHKENELYRKIGQLEVENEFLKKKWHQLKLR